MRTSMKAALALFIALLTACSSQTGDRKRLSSDELDQKSYSISYGATVQTYTDRVNETFDIDSFTKGVDEWYSKKINLPVEQIRAMMLNRMLDHNVYAYYSGILYAADLQANFNHLDPNCWNLVETPSLSQGIYDAMTDLKKNKVRDDAYIKDGVEQILHLCVKTMADDSNNGKASKTKKNK